MPSGRCRTAGVAARLRLVGLGETEVENLDRSLWRQLDVRRLEVRWTMPRSCAASRPSAICPAMASASSTGRALAPRVPPGPRLHELERERDLPVAFLEAVDRRNPWMVQRREQLRLATKPRQPLRIRGEGVGRIFSATSRPAACRGRDRPRPSRPRRWRRRPQRRRSACRSRGACGVRVQGCASLSGAIAPYMSAAFRSCQGRGNVAMMRSIVMLSALLLASTAMAQPLSYSPKWGDLTAGDFVKASSRRSTHACCQSGPSRRRPPGHWRPT